MKKLLLILCCAVEAHAVTVNQLRCEYLDNPRGVDVVKPRLSWVLESGRQTAYQVVVDGVSDTGKVASDRVDQCRVCRQAAESRQRCEWKVRVWDQDDKPSAWSQPATWTMGFLNPRIGRPNGSLVLFGDLPHPWLRRTFVVSSRVKRAEVYVNTPGLYALYLNGKKVGDDVLAPAYSHFPKRMFYTVHEVAALLHPGTNCVALWLAPGWYQPRYGNPYGSPIVRAQLEIETDSGRQVIGTDASWRTAESCITQIGKWGWNDMGGERWDAARFVDGWNQTGFDDSAWNPAREVPRRPQHLARHAAEPDCRRTDQAGEDLPVKDKWVIDFGTTLTGWMRLQLAGLKPGQEVVMDYADLDKPALEHMPNPDGFQTFNQRDVYVAGDKTDGRLLQQVQPARLPLRRDCRVCHARRSWTRRWRCRS